MAATMTQRPRSSSRSRRPAEPRWATPPTPGRKSFGPAIGAVSEALGQPFMPWQEMVAAVGGELITDESTGLLVPAYREVIVTVERQTGKTTIVLAWQGQRAQGWGRPQRIVYSAQTGLDARKKLVEDWCPVLEPRKAKLGIRRILKANGSEAIDYRNGSRTVLMGSGDDAGHGKTVHLGFKDEFFADYDDRRDQALVPAMSTVADAQVVTLSTAGTETSVPLRAAVERGRLAVEQGLNTGTAYFEWSAPDDADIDDPDVWWENIPALGYTITEDVIRHARATLREGEFRRAFLNQWTKTDERVIPAAVWELVCSSTAAPEGDPVFGLDATPERSAAAIVACGAGAIEVIEHRPGLGWVGDWVKGKPERQRALWAIDPAGPAAPFILELEALGCTVVPVGGRDMAAACGSLYDAIADNKVKVRRHGALDAAVAGAKKLVKGDAWVWARKGSVDICPLVAATEAWWVSLHNDGSSVYEDRGMVTLG